MNKLLMVIGSALLRVLGSAGRARPLSVAAVCVLFACILAFASPIAGAPIPPTKTIMSTALDTEVRPELVGDHRQLPRQGDTDSCLLVENGRALSATATDETLVYHSPAITAEQPFNAIGFRILGVIPEGARWELDARASDDSASWSPWVAASPLDAEAGGTLDTDLLFVSGRHVEYRLAIHGTAAEERPELSAVQVTFIDSTRGPSPEQAEAAAGPARYLTALIRPNVVARTSWGANESLRTWPAQYAAPRKLVLHHTATSSNPPDPAAAIRAIYQYHTVTQGWGDIGYNFIIDTRGRVYEGRYGGPGAIGAHAARYNTGSIGIALLGNFASEPPSAGLLKTVEDFLVAKAVQHGIDPAGSGFFVDRELPNIIGHRDVNSTACPGDHMHGQIPVMRERTLAGMPALGQSWVQDTTPLLMDAATEMAVSVTVRNSGRAPWPVVQPNPVRVGFRWYKTDTGGQAGEPGLQVQTDLPRSVLPGEAVKLNAIVRTPSEPGSYVLAWDMVQERVSWFSDQGNLPLEKAVVVGRLDSLPNDVIMQLPNEFLALLPPDRLRSFPLARLTLLSNTELVQLIPDIIPLFPNDRVLSFSNDMLLRYLPDYRLKTFSLERIRTFPAAVQQRLGFPLPTPTPALAAPTPTLATPTPLIPTATPRPASPTPTPAADPGGAAAP